jgi:hypothetical protein
VDVWRGCQGDPPCSCSLQLKPEADLAVFFIAGLNRGVDLVVNFADLAAVAVDPFSSGLKPQDACAKSDMEFSILRACIYHKGVAEGD